MKNKKLLNYSDYLQLEKILSGQELMSAKRVLLLMMRCFLLLFIKYMSFGLNRFCMSLIR